MSAVTPAPPNDSLYSLQPTRPSSVVTFRKSKRAGRRRRAASPGCSIRIAPPRWGQALTSMQLRREPAAACDCIEVEGRALYCGRWRRSQRPADVPHDVPDELPSRRSAGCCVDVEDGRLVGVRGDPDNPDSRGFLCVRGQASREIIDNPRRLLHPLVRARRGEDAWRRDELGRGARPHRRRHARGRPRGGRALVGARALRQQLRHADRLAPAPPVREPLRLSVVDPHDDLLGARRLRPRADRRARGEHQGGHGRARAPRPPVGRQPRQPAEHRRRTWPPPAGAGPTWSRSTCARRRRPRSPTSRS